MPSFPSYFQLQIATINLSYGNPYGDEGYFHKKGLFIQTNDKELLYFAKHNSSVYSYEDMSGGTVLILARGPLFFETHGEDQAFAEACKDVEDRLNKILARRLSGTYATRRDIYRMVKAIQKGLDYISEYIDIALPLQESGKVIHLEDLNAVMSVIVEKQGNIFDET